MYKYIITDIPPSNNKYIGSGRMGSNYAYQEEKRKWEWIVTAAVGQNKPKKPLEKSTVEITYYFKTRHRRDPDNYSGKFLLDGLVKSKVIEDDSFKNIDLVLVGKYDKRNPRTVIKIVSKE